MNPMACNTVYDSNMPHDFRTRYLQELERLDHPLAGLLGLQALRLLLEPVRVVGLHQSLVQGVEVL